MTTPTPNLTDPDLEVIMLKIVDPPPIESAYQSTWHNQAPTPLAVHDPEVNAKLVEKPHNLFVPKVRYANPLTLVKDDNENKI